MTDDEAQRLMSACNRRRDRFLIALLDDSGLRISEALGLRHADLNLRKSEVHVVPRGNNTNQTPVKGMKGRIIPVRPELFDRYAAYMESEYGTLDCDSAGAWTGIVPDGLTGLETKDVRWTGQQAMLLSYTKSRIGEESLVLSAGASRLLEQWIEHSSQARRHAPEDLAGRVWL